MKLNHNHFWQHFSLSRKGLIVIVLPLALLVASLSSLYLRELHLSQLENKLRIALQNQHDIQTVHTQLLEASTGVRDYLLTSDKHFLTIFYRAEKQLPNILSKLRGQLENTKQLQRLNIIQPLVEENLNNLKYLANDGSDHASDFLIAQFKLQVNSLDRLRNEIEQLNAEEAALIANEQKIVTKQRQDNFLITLWAGLIGIIGAIIAMLTFSQTIVKRIKTIRDNADRLAHGEALNLVSTSEDELGQLNNALNHASALLIKNTQAATIAKKEAEEANKAKSMFLSRTSHELRTPLNAISGFAQLLEHELADGNNRNYASMIKSAGDHLLKIINEVLDIARIESGEMSLTLTPIAINPLLEEAIQYSAPMGKMRDIAITQHLEHDLVGMVDRQKLLQVILNLLSNAFKYAPVDSTVQVNAFQRHDRIIVEVFDEGTGIPPDLKSRLFTPFDRLGAEQSKIEGTGLGLALCKQIMHALGGSINVGNHSSLFWIEFKAASSEDKPIINPSLANPQTRSTKAVEKQAVLYVEDNASNRSLVEAIVKRQKHLQLYCVATVREAKYLLSQTHFSLAMIDLNLPDDTGENLVKCMKADPQLAKIAIMILSADAMQATIDRLNNLAIDAYITKPLNIAEFTQQLLRLTQTKTS